MPAGFEPGSDDRIDAGLLKCRSLIGRCRGADGDDAFPPAFLQDFFWWDSVDEAEHWNVRVQQHASLIFKSDRRIRFVCWTRGSQGCDMDSKWRKASVERVFIRCSSIFVFHRHPQVHCERFRCKGRISRMTFLITSGAKPCAPNDPSPPNLETAGVNFCDDSPPS